MFLWTILIKKSERVLVFFDNKNATIMRSYIYVKRTYLKPLIEGFGLMVIRIQFCYKDSYQSVPILPRLL